MLGLLECIATGVLAAASLTATPEILVPDPELDAVLSQDGSVEFAVTIANPSESMAVIAVETLEPVCTSVAIPVEPSSTQEVTVRLQGCDFNLGATTASLSATLIAPDGAMTAVAPVPLEVTVKEAPTAPWEKLGWFGLGLAAVLAVFPPYLTWLAFPQGNSQRSAKFTWADFKTILGKMRPKEWAHHLADDLPGITKDWSFTDSWASNVGLGASLFTGVFASANLVGSILGEGATNTLAVIAVAAAISATVIASGPLWLTILKRRTKQNQGFPRHNTIAGVLAASFVVYFATFGFIATVIALVSQRVPILLPAAVGTAASLLLVVYSWKSIPQTLGLGTIPEAAERGWLVERTQDPKPAYIIREVELGERAARNALGPPRGRIEVTAMQ